MPRNTSIPVFKASNAYKICSKDYIHEKTQFLIIVSAEYGYEKKIWTRAIVKIAIPCRQLPAQS